MLMNEELRKKLLAEEFKLRSKQPTAWTKTKYRPYANFRKPKDFKDIKDVKGDGKEVVKEIVKPIKQN